MLRETPRTGAGGSEHAPPRIERGSGRPKASGRLSGTRLGPLALGITQAAERRLLPRFKVIGYGFDNFCLYGGFGIRVGRPSPKLLRTLTPGARKLITGRIVIALTNNRYYALDGVEPGTTLAKVARKLKVGKHSTSA